MRGATASRGVVWVPQLISIHAPLAGRDRGPGGGLAGRGDFNPRAPCGARHLPTLSSVTHPGFQSTRPLRGATRSAQTSSSIRIFQSTRPLRGATKFVFESKVKRGISIHAPLAGRDQIVWELVGETVISIHAPLAGRDNVAYNIDCMEYIFQSTRPLRGATAPSFTHILPQQFQSTRPLRGATLSFNSYLVLWIYFNPRAPCGARLNLTRQKPPSGPFQSTRPLRGATLVSPLTTSLPEFQSTRPLRGATDPPHRGGGPKPISIHAPLAGRDDPLDLDPIKQSEFQSTRPLRGATKASYFNQRYEEFQSTRPLRGATVLPGLVSDYIIISIHAPLAGRDPPGTPGVWRCPDFNPRAPCGARRLSTIRSSGTARFQSTRPLRGATLGYTVSSAFSIISIHAPLAGRDRNPSGPGRCSRYFNPRAPCGARLRSSVSSLSNSGFQSTRPLRGATAFVGRGSGVLDISIHAPLAGRDGYDPARGNPSVDFNPRAPCGARLLQVHALLVCGRFQSTRPLRGATRAIPDRAPAS